MTFDNPDPNFFPLWMFMNFGFFIAPGVVICVLIWLFANILHFKFSRRVWLIVVIVSFALLPATIFGISVLGG